MTYSTPDNQRNSTRRYTGRAGDIHISNSGPVTSSGTRPAQARGGSSAQYRHSRNHRGYGGSGYQLGGRRRRRGGLIEQALNDPRLLALFIVGFILVLILFLGAISFMRSCSNKRAAEKQAETEQDGLDTRVAITISPEMANEFTERLDRNELFTVIAQNADAVGDTRLLELVLREAGATEFVAAYAKQEVPKKPSPYGEKATQGYYPKLFNWDTRWGYVTYGDGPLGLTGSGPTSLTMAYIGLTGKTDQTPDTIAQKAIEAEGIDASYGTKADFLTKAAREIGLEVEELTPSKENISDNLQSGTAILLQLREHGITDEAHWALAVSRNLDGSINIYDPTSSSVSEHAWDPNTIASSSQAFFALTQSPEAEEESAE